MTKRVKRKTRGRNREKTKQRGRKMQDIEDKAKCLLDYNARTKLKAKYPGVCVIEYESAIQAGQS